MDKCHVARRKHPYAQIMALYDSLPPGAPRPLIFGMTASPTPGEQILQVYCKYYWLCTFQVHSSMGSSLRVWQFLLVVLCICHQGRRPPSSSA
jgi:hypothetical protein